MSSIRLPRQDVLAFLANQRDVELGDDVNVLRVMPRHARLFVAGWMLGDVAAAHALYNAHGNGLLDSPARLTTAAIVAEVLALRARG